MSDGRRAVLLVAGSASVGIAYVLCIKADPAPLDVLRLVPIAWLAGSVLGASRAVRALSHDDGRAAATLALALDVPNALFAVLFALAALVGG